MTQGQVSRAASLLYIVGCARCVLLRAGNPGCARCKLPEVLAIIDCWAIGGRAHPACVSPARGNPCLAINRYSRALLGLQLTADPPVVFWAFGRTYLQVWTYLQVSIPPLTRQLCLQGDKVEGKVKEGFGSLTGDDSKKNEGKAQNASGDVQKTVTENVVDPIKGAAQYVSDTVTGNKK